MKYETILFLPLILLLVAIPAYGYVKMDLPKTVQLGSQLIIHGTAAPSNSTRVNCTVAVNVNGIGYQPANMSHSGTTWTLTNDGHSLKAGDNRVTAKFTCFDPAGNSTIPNFIRHHSENVTGLSSNSSAAPTANDTKSSGKSIMNSDQLVN